MHFPEVLEEALARVEVLLAVSTFTAAKFAYREGAQKEIFAKRFQIFRDVFGDPNDFLVVQVSTGVMLVGNLEYAVDFDGIRFSNVLLVTLQRGRRLGVVSLIVSFGSSTA